MINEPSFKRELQLIISNGIREDVGIEDYSSISCIPKNCSGKAKLLVKSEGIIAGVDFALQAFNYVDKNLKIDVLIQDGEQVSYGDVIFYVSGNLLSILKSERFVLNALQRMSAIATKTTYFISLIKDTKTKLLDTRKTTAGIRALEKWAVKIGGGENHRFGLYDAIMLKDNHIDFVGSISEVVKKTKDYLKKNNKNLKIIIEARNLMEVKEIIKLDGIDRILIDNFNHDDILKAVSLIDGKFDIECSGRIDEGNIRNIAQCDVQYVSCGALTHSVSHFDLSLKSVLNH